MGNNCRILSHSLALPYTVGSNWPIIIRMRMKYFFFTKQAIASNCWDHIVNFGQNLVILGVLKMTFWTACLFSL